MINYIINKNKKAIVSEYLPWILIAVAVLAIVFILIITLKNSGLSWIDKIKNLTRMG